MLNNLCPCCGRAVDVDHILDDLRVDIDTNRFFINGTARAISPQLAEVLFSLRKRYPEPVTKESLAAALWGNGTDKFSDALGCDANIRVLVNGLRRVLSGTGWAVVTVATKGYLLAKVME